MTWLTAISKVMDIKIVQWVMLGLIICLTGGLIFTQIRYSGLKLDHALLEVKYTKLDSAVAIQNKAIEDANKVTKQYQVQAQQAAQNADKLNKLNEANKLKLKSFQFKPNSTCDEKVNQLFLQYSSMRHK